MGSVIEGEDVTEDYGDKAPVHAFTMMVDKVQKPILNDLSSPTRT